MKRPPKLATRSRSKTGSGSRTIRKRRNRRRKSGQGDRVGKKTHVRTSKKSSKISSQQRIRNTVMYSNRDFKLSKNFLALDKTAYSRFSSGTRPPSRYTASSMITFDLSGINQLSTPNKLEDKTNSNIKMTSVMSPNDQGSFKQLQKYPATSGKLYFQYFDQLILSYDTGRKTATETTATTATTGPKDLTTKSQPKPKQPGRNDCRKSNNSPKEGRQLSKPSYCLVSTDKTLSKFSDKKTNTAPDEPNSELDTSRSNLEREFRHRLKTSQKLSPIVRSYTLKGCSDVQTKVLGEKGRPFEKEQAKTSDEKIFVDEVASTDSHQSSGDINSAKHSAPAKPGLLEFRSSGISLSAEDRRDDARGDTQRAGVRDKKNQRLKYRKKLPREPRLPLAQMELIYPPYNLGQSPRDTRTSASGQGVFTDAGKSTLVPGGFVDSMVTESESSDVSVSGHRERRSSKRVSKLRNREVAMTLARGLHGDALLTKVKADCHVKGYEILRKLVRSGATGECQTFLANNENDVRFSPVEVTAHRLSRPNTATTKTDLRGTRGSKRDKHITRIFSIISPHPNLIMLLHSFSSSSWTYHVTEHRPWPSVAHLISLSRGVASGACRGLEEAVCVTVFRQMCSGLAHLHENAILHGDLNCCNVLVTDALEVKLTGYGPLCQRVQRSGRGENSHAEFFDGYTPPEVMTREVAWTRSCDMWCMGVALLHMVLGSIPPDINTAILLSGSSRTVTKFTQDKIGYQLSLLIDRLLQSKRNQRATVWQIMGHPWLATHTDPATTWATSGRRQAKRTDGLSFPLPKRVRNQPNPTSEAFHSSADSRTNTPEEEEEEEEEKDDVITPTPNQNAENVGPENKLRHLLESTVNRDDVISGSLDGTEENRKQSEGEAMGKHKAGCKDHVREEVGDSGDDCTLCSVVGSTGKETGLNQLIQLDKTKRRTTPSSGQGSTIDRSVGDVTVYDVMSQDVSVRANHLQSGDSFPERSLHPAGKMAGGPSCGGSVREDQKDNEDEKNNDDGGDDDDADDNASSEDVTDGDDDDDDEDVPSDASGNDDGSEEEEEDDELWHVSDPGDDDHQTLLSCSQEKTDRTVSGTTA